MNLGPRPDGTMRPEFYRRLEDIAGWMDHSRSSVIGAGAVANWQNFSAVPITRRENISLHEEVAIQPAPGRPPELA